MECKFVVGQKVVAIADRWAVFNPEGREGLPGFPVKGEIYTVAAIILEFGLPLLRLKELHPCDRFHHTGFRPLQDRPKEADTDISVFYPALNVKKLEPAQ
jgi:hypothetical protein